MPKAYIETYGCSLNKADSSVIQSILLENGYEITDSPEGADLIIVNTCTVRKETEDRMISRIRELKKFKNLVVAGCLASAQPSLVLKEYPEARLISPQSIGRIMDVIEGKEKIVLTPSGKSKLPSFFSQSVATIPIQDGCLGECSFCITKIARRKLMSYPIRAIVESVKKAVKSGVKEIDLTGQDVATYGIDLFGRSALKELMEYIDEMEGDFLVRLGMMTPEIAMKIIDDLKEIIKMKKVFKFLHLPVQSGDDKVLRIMKRKYSVEEYKELINEIRKTTSEITIATDIIIGHPGEDEEAFNNTLKLMEEIRFERVHLAMYSVRPNTLSASMKQIPEVEKKRRMRIAYDKMVKICSEIHSNYLGRIEEVMITEEGKHNTVVGRTLNYIPVIISKGNISSIVKVKITDYTYYDLRGEVLTINNK